MWLTGARVTHVSALLATHVAERADEESGAARAVTSDDEADMLLHFAGGARTQSAWRASSTSRTPPRTGAM